MTAAALVDWETYRAITGDADSHYAVVETRVGMATDLLDDVLDRWLREDDHTEVVKVSPSGRAFPRGFPVTSLADGQTCRIETPAVLANVSVDGAPSFDLTDFADAVDRAYPATWPTATVTYRGGYTATTCPFRLKAAIAHLARAFGTNPGWTPPAVGSRSVGDVSIVVGVADTSKGAMVDALVPGLWATIVGFRRRTS